MHWETDKYKQILGNNISFDFLGNFLLILPITYWQWLARQNWIASWLHDRIFYSFLIAKINIDFAKILRFYKLRLLGRLVGNI